jgi:hypothetical protein
MSIIYCDACPQGMGFWYSATRRGFVSPTPSNIFTQLNLLFEALCMLSALHDAHNKSLSGKEHIIIYTDNLNTVNIFNFL